MKFVYVYCQVNGKLMLFDRPFFVCVTLSLLTAHILPTLSSDISHYSAFLQHGHISTRPTSCETLCSVVFSQLPSCVILNK